MTSLAETSTPPGVGVGGGVRSSLRQSLEDGVDLLGNSCQGKFKLVLETRIKSFRCLKLFKSSTADKYIQ